MIFDGNNVYFNFTEAAAIGESVVKFLQEAERKGIPVARVHESVFTLSFEKDRVECCVSVPRK